MLSATPGRPAEAVGAELDDDQILDCRTRLGDRAGFSFVSIASLDSPAHHGRYDVVVCMEVLEHVVELDTVIDRLWRTARRGRHPSGQRARGNRAPVAREAGRPTHRRLARSRRLPGTSPYSWSEYGASVFAGSRPHLTRPIYGERTPFHDHKGFNWMALRDRLAQRFDIGRVVASPVAWLGPHLATQVWFVARKARRAGDSPL